MLVALAACHAVMISCPARYRVRYNNAGPELRISSVYGRDPLQFQPATSLPSVSFALTAATASDRS